MLLHIKSKFINIFKHLNVLNILIYKYNILSKSCISKAIQVLRINCKKQNCMKTPKLTRVDLYSVVQG